MQNREDSMLYELIWFQPIVNRSMGCFYANRKRNTMAKEILSAFADRAAATAQQLKHYRDKHEMRWAKCAIRKFRV